MNKAVQSIRTIATAVFHGLVVLGVLLLFAVFCVAMGAQA